MNKNKLKKLKSRGVTLIELLVVISFIGLISSVLMVGVKKAKDKAGSVVIEKAILDTRIIAEMIYQDDNRYDDLCMDPLGLGRLNILNVNYGHQLAEIESFIQENGGWALCFADDNLYCVSSRLENHEKSICIDQDNNIYKGSIEESTKAQCTNKTGIPIGPPECQLKILIGP